MRPAPNGRPRSLLPTGRIHSSRQQRRKPRLPMPLPAREATAEVRGQSKEKSEQTAALPPARLSYPPTRTQCRRRAVAKANCYADEDRSPDPQDLDRDGGEVPAPHSP